MRICEPSNWSALKLWNRLLSLVSFCNVLVLGTKESRVYNYVYLLCDSLIWHDNMDFGDFSNPIFYVGRDVEDRFLDHLREAHFEPRLLQNPKEAKILDIWQDGPVNVLIINLDNYAEKMDFIEFALMFALGLGNLTKKKYDGATVVSEGFGVEDVCKTVLYYLAQTFNDRGKCLECFHDDD